MRTANGARASDGQPVIRVGRPSIPEHVESALLRGPVRLLAWIFAIAGIVGGVTLTAVVEGAAAEVVAALAVVLGGGALGAVVKCSRYEITVGTTRIDLGTGPFRETLATGAVERASARSASGWRRLYASEEVLLEVASGRRQRFVVPTADARALVTALRTDGTD